MDAQDGWAFESYSTSSLLRRCNRRDRILETIAFMDNDNGRNRQVNTASSGGVGTTTAHSVDPVPIRKLVPKKVRVAFKGDDGDRLGNEANLKTALLALEVGLSPVPPVQDGTKRPLADIPKDDGEGSTWEPYQNKPATEIQVRAWYRDGRTGNGLATGYGGLECFEFDNKSVYHDFMDAAGEAGLLDLVDRIRAGYEEFTPGDGVHWLYRAEELEGNTKLAERPHPIDSNKRDVLIETRARGGYIITAPSHGTVHPSGKPYVLVLGGLDQIVTITASQRRSLFSFARSFSQMPVKVDGGFKSVPRVPKGQDDGSVTPLNDFNARVDWMDILAGWTRVYEHSGAIKLRRPGKSIGISASIKDGSLYVYTTSTTFEAEQAYSKAGAYCLLNHNGDWKACVTALVEKGYGTWIDRDGEEHQNPRPPKSTRRVNRDDGQPSLGKCPLSATSEPTAQLARNGRPEIEITTEERQVNNEALAALGDDPDLYRLGYVLATVIQDPDPPRGIEYLDGPSPQINPLDPAILREHLSAAAMWIQSKVKKVKGQEVVVRQPAHPPAFTINAIHKRKVYPGIRPIEGIIESPTMRPNGSILCKAGYDRETRLYLQPNIEIDSIPEHPTSGQAEQALEVIYDLVSDFPFKGATEKVAEGAHKAVWLTGLLTVIGRASFRGPAPLFAFDGNCPGSGKTKLADIISITASGRRMPRSTLPGGESADEEVRKRITSLAMQGERFVLLDNVDCEIGGAALDAALTADTWKDRLLGTNQVPEIPMKIIWFASANNIGFKGDFIRRALVSRLETSMEKPEERTGFKYPDLLKHTLENRATILRAALLILRAHRANGEPKLVDPLGSFENWTHAIVDPVRWITGINPLGVRPDVKASDRKHRMRMALIHGWKELEGGTIGGITVAAALAQLRLDTSGKKFPVLRDALAQMSDRADLPSARSIGSHFSAMLDRNFDGYVVKAIDVRSGVCAWKVVPAQTV